MSKLSDRRKEIREYTTEQADQELQRLQRQLFDLRIQQQRGEVKNNRQFTQVRTDIARLRYQLDLLALAEAEEELAEEEELEEELEEAEEEAEAEEDEGDDDGDDDDGDDDDDEQDDDDSEADESDDDDEESDDEEEE
ncbi:MAG TPA: 50S ribosomal protein L29 [Ktedonobacterales bacterium]|nr:50S ribosomal protein L29 [Ktedonobacterales bacterium]